MPIGSYHLLAQLGAGADGALYRAADAAGVPVEVRILGGASTDAGGWKELTRRLRLAALLDHPATIRVRELGLDEGPPFAALEWVAAPTLAEAFAEEAPSAPAALRIARDLCSALWESHCLGLAHGRLSPSRIRLTDAGAVKLDFTGLEIGAAPAPAAFAEFEAACRAPEATAGGPADAAADLYSLGMILYWLLRGRPGPLGRSRQDIVCDFQQETRAVEASWQNLIPLLLAAEPADRPLIRSLLAQMPDEAVASADTMNSTTAAGLPAPGGEPGGGAPERVGRFRLVQKLGEGGMGSVYRADELTDGTVVAVKLLRGRWSDHEAAWRRMRKERVCWPRSTIPTSPI